MGRSTPSAWDNVLYRTVPTETIFNSSQKQMGTTKITTKRTLILTIEELYRIIPDTKELEGRNFKNLKELLVNLIEKIEESGHWEFVQYVVSTPSMFIVRELTVKEIFEYDKDEKEERRPLINGRPLNQKHSIDAPVLKSEMSTSILTGKLPWET